MTLDALNVFSVFICLMEMYINSCVFIKNPLNMISNHCCSSRTSEYNKCLKN